ncbi:MAG: alkaline phosphatase, partial [Bacteroidales bacterium]|nr:alkaline phosphatase [Bacteroidales bacterium]
NEAGSANETLLEWAEKRGKATGIVVTVPITNATPADFYAHVTSRKMEEEIARQLVYSGIDFAIGGYRNYFLPQKRKDGLNLIDSLTARNYQVVSSTQEVAQLEQLPAVGLLTDKNPPRAAQRSDWTEVAVNKALQLLSTDEDGFFLMIEGSQIDWGCHANNFNYMCGELLDFDRAVQIAYNFAQSHPNTLVIVTADHETGGLRINRKVDKLSAEQAKKKVRNYASWKKFYHTNTNVPVYAFGPGAELFQGVMNNIDIYSKIVKIWK